MAYIRNCFFLAVLFFAFTPVKAQTVYYPAHSSQLLISTAEDIARLFEQAIPNSRFTVQEYINLPDSGIIFNYDSTISSNQSCRVLSNGTSFIKFSASQDNGLNFGVYQYLRQVGFRFYQPGSIWQIIPQLNSPYINISKTYSCEFKYRNWFVSGGCNRWAMDLNNNYSWDTYYGENGHNWALYQRRNGMTGEYFFAGHRGDLMSGSYLTSLQQNPCYVACYNGSRNATTESVPDIHNNSAMQLWGNTIEEHFKYIKNIIYGNPVLYANYYRNFNYYNELIGIEVPDGSRWGNSKDAGTCSNADYPKESDQNFILANHTAQKINLSNPDKHFQLYAYATHADVPSASITINRNIDIQIIPEVYQLETSTNGMRNRWFNRSSNISEYNYLNLADWTGETPLYNWTDLKNTLAISKSKKSQGLIWEASPAKFGSLPYLLAASNNLIHGMAVDSTLHEFCDNMFAGANNTIYKMLQNFGNKESVPDKYKMQLYLQLLNTATNQTLSAGNLVKERIRELKAYVHYMVLYFDLAKDDQNKIAPEVKESAICIYLARTHKLQLVNSYYIIATIANRYARTSQFYIRYNNADGTAYQNGNLPLISDEEIDLNFLQDLSKYGNLLAQINLVSAGECQAQFKTAHISPPDKINAKIHYTNGLNYYNKSVFTFISPAAESFSIQYTPHYYMQGKGYVNFLVESADKILTIIQDFTIDQSSLGGTITINLPEAGNYILTVSSQYQSAIDLSITTNGIYFYKNGAFLGNSTENYKSDSASLPGYFYVAPGLKKIYFLVNNSVSGGKYASAEVIGHSFNIKDQNGVYVQPGFVTPKDSSLFYLEIPESAAGTFWHVTKMDGYRLQFINIINLLWFAWQEKTCIKTDFSVSVINLMGNCITRLLANAKPDSLKWEVIDKGRSVFFENQAVIDLPVSTANDIIITLTNGSKCSLTKRTADDPKYVLAKEACNKEFSIAGIAKVPVLYPNPSTGVFNILLNGMIQRASKIEITSSEGIRVGSFSDIKQINICNVASGIYWYRVVINGKEFKGKLSKL